MMMSAILQIRWHILQSQNFLCWNEFLLNFSFHLKCERSIRETEAINQSLIGIRDRDLTTTWPKQT